jgi:2-desacetyl-2-hydroxyethyl bacteriochlorophyllide A dehydrogenase
VIRARQVVFSGPRRVEVRDVEVSEPGEGEVVVRSAFSGISSGTEMLAYRGEVDPDLPLDETIGALGGTFRYPFTYGYSCAGHVEVPGGGLEEGAAVFALHPHQDRFCLPATDVLALGDVPLRLVTLLPLVETALQICLDAGPVADETVVVVGLGTVGLLSGALLGRAGARVLGAEPRQWRRELASGFGVEAAAPEDLAGRVEEATGGAGVPLVVEVSGNPDALAGSLPLLSHEGTALVASWYGTKPVSLLLGGQFHRRRLSLRSTQVSTIPSALQGRWTVARRRSVALELLSELPVELLATHQFPFAEAPAAFAAVDRGEEGLVHAALWYG